MGTVTNKSAITTTNELRLLSNEDYKNNVYNTVKFKEQALFVCNAQVPSLRLAPASELTLKYTGVAKNPTTFVDQSVNLTNRRR